MVGLNKGVYYMLLFLYFDVNSFYFLDFDEYQGNEVRRI